MKPKVRIIIRLLLCAFMFTGCASTGTGAAAEQAAYSYTEYSIDRNGIALHLDCMKVENTEPENNILLMHGSTYSSHEFDIDYEDYSLVRRLARDGYAPILTGIGEAEIAAPFNHNDWAGAAEDFQTREDGSFDTEVTDPVLIEMWCSSCWHYDGDSSPNGWRKDALVSEDNILINLEEITVPTLVICGDKDPYLNMDAVNSSPEKLPEGSELKVIPGGSHILLYEKNYYKEFQDDVSSFLLGK